MKILITGFVGILITTAISMSGIYYAIGVDSPLLVFWFATIPSIVGSYITYKIISKLLDLEFKREIKQSLNN